ncbi:MAG: hypothetical protein Q9220_005737 [cf. Caloplaca sp. 1 TL-2023]
MGDESDNHFRISAMNAGNAEDAFMESRKKVIDEESAEFATNSITRYSPGKRIKPDKEHDWLQNHYHDNNEIFQWLFLTGGLFPTGPEQIWIERRHHSGCGEDTGSCGAGQREAVSSFRLTAGSISMGYHGEYCYDEAQVGGFQQLAVLFPGMWKRPCISLGEFEFYRVADIATNTAGLWQEIVTKPIHRHPDSPDGFRMLKKWLSECKATHSHCQKESAPQSNRPPRLLHVGTPDGSQEPHLYIVLEGQVVPYTTLSYCPGLPPGNEKSCNTLSSSNYESMQTHTRLGELARTFQDAIVITRALSISFLWIDALCIIQDSPQDCATESSKRMQYFANSELNIAATASPHAQHGILHPRDIALNSVSLTNAAAAIGVRPIAEDIFGLIRNQRFFPKRPPLSPQPLNQLSHALLERMSSPRTVHFTNQQMIWQCQTCLIGEDGQVGEDRDRFRKLCSNRPFDIHLRQPMREITAANENEHHCDPDMSLQAPIRGHTGVKYSLDEALMDIGWYDLISEYTSRSPNSPHNILPLLSSFAQRIQEQTKASYLAGLWAAEDDQIPFRSLLWYCKTPGTFAGNGSPSWSWSSVISSGGVTHPGRWMYRMDHPGARSKWVPKGARRQQHVLSYPCQDSQVRVLNAQTVISAASGSNVFGTVEGGRLEVTGLVHRFTGVEEWDFAAEMGCSRRDPAQGGVEDGDFTGSRKIFYTDAYEAEKGDESGEKEGGEEGGESERKGGKGGNDGEDLTNGDRHFTLALHLDHLSPITPYDYHTREHLLLLVAEFRDELDSSQKPHMTPKDAIYLLILRQVVTAETASDEGRGDVDRENTYERIGIAQLQRKSKDLGWGGKGLWGVHSNYSPKNGWKRRKLILV